MKKLLIVSLLFCILMLAMATGLSAAEPPGGTAPDVKALCIDQGQTCVINGTACCGAYKCKGKFPNTYCQ